MKQKDLKELEKPGNLYMMRKITHKHPDHTGELRMFPNAKIYISEKKADDMKLTGDNVVRVKFTDGAFKNFQLKYCYSSLFNKNSA